MIYKRCSPQYFPQVIGFFISRETPAHKNSTRRIKIRKTQQESSVICEDKQVVASTLSYPFRYFIFVLTPTFSPLRGVRPLQSLPQYAITIPHPTIWLRNRVHFYDPASDMIGGTLICQPFLCGRRIHSHKYPVFIPLIGTPSTISLPICLILASRISNYSVLVDPYLLMSSSASNPIIPHLFYFHHHIASLPHIFLCCIGRPASLPPYLLPYLSTIPVILRV